jgi:hypothetical protein
MCKKMIGFISIVMILVLANNVSAATVEWDGGGADNLWSTAENWDGDSVPGSGDNTRINIPDANCLIDSSVDAVCKSLAVGYEEAGPCYLNMTGGTLTMSGNMKVGDEPDSNGIFIMTGGTVSITGSSADLYIAEGSNYDNPTTYGTLIMTGGVFNIGDKLELGKNKTGVGRIYMDGGTIEIADDFELGKYGNATFVMTGGDVNVVDTLKLGPENKAGISHIDLYGGIIRCDDMLMRDSDTTIDITEGAMFIESDDALSTVQQYVSNEWITGYGGAGDVDVFLAGGGVNVTARLGDPNLAWGPSPSDYATVEWTPAGPTLSWLPGQYAVSHDVYFGTDEDDVNTATPSSDEFKVNQDPCSYPTGPLELGTTYYWRIDEVNENAWAPPGSPWKGNVWEFTVAEYLDVESFDSYANDGELEAVWNLTGSDISLEDTIIYTDEGKSMKYQYTTGSPPYYTEASANTSSLQVTQDWTSADVKALVLYFFGDGYNEAEQMYVGLKDTSNKMAVVYYNGEPNDINEPEWHEWNIELNDFKDTNNVNLSSIDKVYIGFGDGVEPGGSGEVIFDDIRLYPTRCVASLAPEGDMDDDCDVDCDDYVTMAGDWRERDYIGVGSDGVLDVNFPSDNSQWVNDPVRDRCLQFDGINDWVDLDNNQFSNFHNKTISLWVKIREYPATIYRYIFYFANADETTPYRIYILTRTDGVVRARFIKDYSVDFIAGTDTWCHLAFVIRDTDDGKCTGEFYGNGFLVDDWEPGQPRHSGGAIGVNLGSENDGSGSFVNAVYDDFRVYDYALSQFEINYLAGKGGTEPNDMMLLHYKFDEVSGLTAMNSSTYVFYRPLLSAAELYTGEAEGSRVVNFRDFAIFVDSWLEEQLWP